ncbi:MAG: peptide/nickel transport system permease protein [Solirubrobacteraceae bacterium]|nr:peptide/nickel transport system permease protein [Solirubrobacteraceae bacterium]
MRSGSLLAFTGRRLAALAATVVLAPTFAYTVFNGLSGTADRPLPAFAWDYAVTTFWRLDLGRSESYQEPVARVVAWSLPVDLAMVLGGIATGVLLGVAGGLLCAARSGSVGARAAQGLAIFVLSSPPYWMGLMVLVFFAPGTGYLLEIPFVSGLMEYTPLTQDPLMWLKGLWMPWLMVGLPLAAAVLRMTAATLRDALGEEFLRTARGKGVSERRVLTRHALPLAAAPVAALTGANMAMLITNVALMESAFNIPGIFREIREVASFTDWPLLQAMVIETTVLIVVANMAADTIQARLDPRVG